LSGVCAAIASAKHHFAKRKAAATQIKAAATTMIRFGAVSISIDLIIGFSASCLQLPLKK
jgi:coproporphyrinogen III oxidase-like Fe-S oxidoreductase